jgi:hypothetical protein
MNNHLINLAGLINDLESTLHPYSCFLLSLFALQGTPINFNLFLPTIGKLFVALTRAPIIRT